MAPKVAPIQNDFGSGEITPLAQARTNVDLIKAGVHTCQRYLPTVQGGATRCPGTKYLGSVASLSAAGIAAGQRPILVGFEFSNTQAYMIEFGGETQIVRFWKNRAQITSAGSPYQISCPYDGLSLQKCQFFQSNDVLYITHPNLAPRKLIRRGDADWYFETISFEDGPYLPIVYPDGNHPNLRNAGSAAQYGTTQLTSFVSSISSVATTATAYRVTLTGTHGFIQGERVAIDGVVGSATLMQSLNNVYGPNAFHSITTVSSNSFDVSGLTGTIAGAYASAGTVYWAAFGPLDDGRLARVKQAYSPNQWVWGTLSRTGSPYHVGKMDFVVQGTNSINTGTPSQFRLGVWRTGSQSGFPSSYPATATIHENRLSFYGAPLDPTRVDMSNSDDYENFSPADEDGTVTDSHALSFPLAANGVQAGVWIASGEKGLFAGSVGGEWVVRPSNQYEALTPTNITVKETSVEGGVEYIGAIKVGKAILFVQRAGKKLMEYQYFYDVDGHRCEDLTEIAEHMTLNGIRRIVYQKTPQPIVWVLRDDGKLVGVTYKRTQDLQRFGWHRHPVGGYVNASGDPAVIEDIGIIPSPDGTTNDLWMVVRRFVNGQTRYQMEYVTPIFDASIEAEDAFFVDCGLTYDSPLTVESISSVATNRVLFTITSHGLSNGNKVRVNGVVGLTSSINSNDFIATAASTNTFILQNVSSTNINWNDISSTGSLSYLSGGSVRKYVSTISGLGHLEGQAVVALVDGEPVDDLTVTGSAVVLPAAGVKAHIGYNYASRIKTLRFEAGAADGTSIGKKQRSAQLGLYLDRTGKGLKIGRDFDNMLSVPIEETDLPLYSGITVQSFEDDYTLDNRVCIEHNTPTPSTILAIMPDMVTQDG